MIYIFFFRKINVCDLVSYSNDNVFRGSCFVFNLCFFLSFSETQTVPSLTELAAKCVASHIPFELVEHVYPPVPEQLQLRIAFWSFPDNEEDIRLYSCLANGAADEFTRGEHLVRNNMVKDPLQIGKCLFLSSSFLLPTI